MHPGIKTILQQQDLCVLATSSSEGPHCSLMAFICDESCTRLFMVTLRETRKFANLQKHDMVSILIDNRLILQNRREMQALTIQGRYCPLVNPSEITKVQSQFLKKHPHLTELASKKGACFFAIDIQKLQLLTGATDAHYEIPGRR